MLSVPSAGAVGWFLVVALGALAAYLQFARARLQGTVLEAQEQTREILKTVQEGVFLLDAEHRITGVWSDALSRLFGRTDLGGLSFEDLLKDLVTPDTLATAQKYIKLLWGERAQHLIKDINPLSELEIAPDKARGGRESRFLQFAFNRVMGPQGVKHILCSVTDATAAVMLARETRGVQESPQDANAHVEMMLDLIQVDPLRLGAFLTTADTGLEIVNTMLRKPARSDAEFRDKLHGLSQQFQALTAEAASPRSAEEFATLPGIAEILAKEHEKRLALTVVGLDRVPGPYLATIKSCLIHMLRNAAMHGIESPMVRRAENKDETGTLKITFAAAADGYQLVFEDDGVGISAESLKQAALRQQLFGLEEAAVMDSRAAVAMIFRPGFSTWKKPTNDIGRGLGMDEVARAVHGLGGRIGVSTRPGKYTRFTVTLPAVAAARSEVA